MSDIVHRLRDWRNLHLARGGELFEAAADEIERLRNGAAGYTDGISAGGESNQSHEKSDEKHGVSDTARPTLTAEEREAISEVVDCLTESGTGLASPTTTRNTSDIRVWDGTTWVSLRGPTGNTDAQGRLRHFWPVSLDASPTVTSSDAGASMT